jgi:hypothetical protein
VTCAPRLRGTRWRTLRPRGARPKRRVIARLKPVSSAKTSRRRAMAATSSRKSARCRSSRSAASRLFFTGEAEPTQRAADRRRVSAHASARPQVVAQFGERRVGAAGDPLAQQREGRAVYTRRVATAVRPRPQARAGAREADEAGDRAPPDLEGVGDLIEGAVAALVSRDDLLA